MPTDTPDHTPKKMPRSSTDPSRRTKGLPAGAKPHDAWGDNRSATSPQSDPQLHDGNARPGQVRKPSRR